MYSMFRKKNRQAGLAVVEFAIALPFLVLVALAVVELGRGLYQYNTLTKAVHDGARFLADDVMDGSGTINLTQDLIDATKNLVVYGTIDTSGNQVLKNLSVSNVAVTTEFVLLSDGAADDNHIKVSATHTFQPLFPALSVLGYSMLPTMTASTVERALQI